MALVQSLPAPDPRLHRRSPTSPPSRRVSSHREAPAGRRRRGFVGKGFGSRSYSHEDLIRDWSDAGVDGPPKLVSVSGQLERNVQQAIVRPTAFKPVVPRTRFFAPRLGGSQGNLSVFSSGDEEPTERRSSYSGTRNGLRRSFNVTETTPHATTHVSHAAKASSNSHVSHAAKASSNSHVSHAAKASSNSHVSHAAKASSNSHISHAAKASSNSDSGRSSSSKSTGSGVRDVTGPVEAYEAIVRDLEERLREREQELQRLRGNLNENEAAICQAYEDRQKRSELDMEELRQTCAAKMQASAQTAQRDLQLLQLQAFQLQQEKQQLQEDLRRRLQEHQRLEERCSSYEREHTQMAPRLEETKWEVCQKSGEISLLKQQLKDLQVELSQRAGEQVCLRRQLRDCKARLQDAQAASHTHTLQLEVCENELQRRRSENQLLREKMSRLQELANEGEASRQHCDRLQAELAHERQRASNREAAFLGERRGWEEEKRKVIGYQQQLQQNYMQTRSRNAELQTRLQRLSLQLQRREQEDDSSGNEVTFDDITEI